MEGKLDAIAHGDLKRRTFLDNFYRGKEPGLHKIVTGKLEQIHPKDVGTIPIGEKNGQKISVRVGRYGPYIEHGDERASVPEGLALDEVTTDKALELLAAASKADEPIGHAPDGQPVFVRTGRFGPYVQLGEDTGDKKIKPKRASVFKSMDARHLTLEQALSLLSLPRTLGVAPDGGTVVARSGRFGPYLEKTVEGAEKPETRSLKSEEELLTITLDEALALFAVPKRGRGRAAIPPPIKEMGIDPVSAAPIVLQRRPLRSLRERRHHERVPAEGDERRGPDPRGVHPPPRRAPRARPAEEEETHPVLNRSPARPVLQKKKGGGGVPPPSTI